jgi:hypothetical protein
MNKNDKLKNNPVFCQLLRLIEYVVLVALLSVSTQGQVRDEKYLAPVPRPVRGRLIERLKLLLEYERTRQYDKEFDLLSNIYTQESREKFLKRIGGKDKLDFTPISIGIVLREKDYEWWWIDGCATKIDSGKRLDAYVWAYLQHGEWYFSVVAINVPIDGAPKPCLPQRKSTQRTRQRTAARPSPCSAAKVGHPIIGPYIRDS